MKKKQQTNKKSKKLQQTQQEKGKQPARTMKSNWLLAKQRGRVNLRDEGFHQGIFFSRARHGVTS